MFMKVSENCSVVSDSLQSHELYSPWDFPSQNTGVGSRALLQGIFPTQGLSPGLPHCRWILYQQSQQGRPHPAGPPICEGCQGKTRLCPFSPHCSPLSSLNFLLHPVACLLTALSWKLQVIHHFCTDLTAVLFLLKHLNRQTKEQSSNKKANLNEYRLLSNRKTSEKVHILSLAQNLVLTWNGFQSLRPHTPGRDGTN